MKRKPNVKKNEGLQLMFLKEAKDGLLFLPQTLMFLLTLILLALIVVTTMMSRLTYSTKETKIANNTKIMKLIQSF